MESIQDTLEDYIVPIQSNIHSCFNTVGSETLLSGVRTLYTNDKVAYEYANGDTDLWDSVSSLIKDSIVDSKVDIVVGGILNTPTANNRLRVELVIDAATEIPIRTRVIPVLRNAVDIDEFISFNVYNGVAALADGFKVYLTAEVANLTIKNKTILVRV